MRKWGGVFTTANLYCFVGMDGSGKSTITKNVRDELNSKGRNATTIWWLSCEDSTLRKFLRRIGKIESSAGENGQTGIIKNNLLSRVYIFLVTADYLRYGIVKISYPVKRSKGTILLDRYYFDTVQALDGEYPGNSSYLALIQKVFSTFLPKPKKIFFIDVSPETSLKRKPLEIKSLENATLLKNTYDIYLKQIEKNNHAVFVVDNNRELATSQQLVISEIEI